MIYISSTNVRHPFTKTFTALHYTCRHFTSSHLNFTQLHFTTLLFWHEERSSICAPSVACMTISCGCVPIQRHFFISNNHHFETEAQIL